MSSDNDLKIHYVQNNVVAFSLGFDLYFLRCFPVPQIFNSSLTPQLIPNIDSWFQAKTQQRYSYRGFLDIVGGFVAGLGHTYSIAEIKALCVQTTLTAKKTILTELMSDYKKHFWVECLDPVKLEGMYAESVREKFDRLRQSLGDDEFYNYLCRLWKLARQYRPSIAVVFERLVDRLGRVADEPKYPDTKDLDDKLLKLVLGSVLEKVTDAHHGVSKEIQAKLEALRYVERSDLESKV